jgi:1-aminocyclopropane-1-carboxylate deaminase/D-cysteine desulfhydrase-like pyridoxal-dependent ACC family enzyme
MMAGKELFGFKGKVLGISVDEKSAPFKEIAITLAKDVTELLGNAKDFTKDDCLVNDDYLGGGYAVMGEPEREAIHLFARHEALFVDPVYTGRAAAGLIDLIRQGFFKPDETVLFWHTGGTPALFAEEYVKGLV